MVNWIKLFYNIVPPLQKQQSFTEDLNGLHSPFLTCLLSFLDNSTGKHLLFLQTLYNTQMWAFIWLIYQETSSCALLHKPCSNIIFEQTILYSLSIRKHTFLKLQQMSVTLKASFQNIIWRAGPVAQRVFSALHQRDTEPREFPWQLRLSAVCSVQISHYHKNTIYIFPNHFLTF